MQIRPIEETDKFPKSAPINMRYLAHARASGMYLGYAFVDGERVVGFGEAGFAFHATRGNTVRARRAWGPDAFFGPFLHTLEMHAQANECDVAYVSSPSSSPLLGKVASVMGYTRLDELVMCRHNQHKGMIPDHPLPEGHAVRPMTAEEYPFAWEHLLPGVSGGDVLATEAAVCAAMASNTYCPYVVEGPDGLVAYAELELFHELFAHRPVGRVERVVVAQEARGQKLARSLVAALLRRSVELGCSAVELQVRRTNDAAIKTYEWLGFRPTDDRLFYKSI